VTVITGEKGMLVAGTLTTDVTCYENGRMLRARRVAIPEVSSAS